MNENKNSKIVWMVLILIIVVIGVAVNYLYKDGKTVVTTSENIGGRNPTVAQTVSVLESTVSFVNKEVNSTSIVLPSEVGRDLSFFISDKANSLEVKKILFKNGKNGYEFKYNLDMNLPDTFNVMRGIARTLPFVLSNATRANQASVITTESEKYEAKILLSKVDEVRTEVIVTIQPN